MADWARRMIGAFGSRHRWADLAPTGSGVPAK